MKKTNVLMILALLTVPPAASEGNSLINRPESDVKAYFEIETGLVSILNHRY